MGWKEPQGRSALQLSRDPRQGQPRSPGSRWKVIDHGANDVHPVVHVDEIHRRHNQQRYA
jgi:hypothetical protein